MMSVVCNMLPYNLLGKFLTGLLNSRSDTGCHVFCYALFGVCLILCERKSRASPEITLIFCNPQLKLWAINCNQHLF